MKTAYRYESPEAIIVAATADDIAAVERGTATDAQTAAVTQAGLWGLVAAVDARTPCSREAEKTIASFAIGAAAMACRDKAGGGHAVNQSPTSHCRNLAAFSYHNVPVLYTPTVAGQAASIVLTTAGAGADTDTPKVSDAGLVELLKAAWKDRKSALQASAAGRQRALEASNTFTEEEGVSRRMIYHALDHFSGMAILAPPSPSLEAPLNPDVLVLLQLRMHNHVSTRWQKPPVGPGFAALAAAAALYEALPTDVINIMSTEAVAALEQAARYVAVGGMALSNHGRFVAALEKSRGLTRAAMTLMTSGNFRADVAAAIYVLAELAPAATILEYWDLNPSWPFLLQWPRPRALKRAFSSSGRGTKGRSQ